MKAEYKIKREIIEKVLSYEKDFTIDFKLDTEDNIEKAYKLIVKEGLHYDCRNEFRESYNEETDIEHDWSRHCEIKSVAKQLNDGSWVGWSYEYGGGKHFECDPNSWMENAYNLSCKEEEKMVIVREFKKQD